MKFITYGLITDQNVLYSTLSSTKAFGRYYAGEISHLESMFETIYHNNFSYDMLQPMVAIYFQPQVNKIR